MLLCVVAFRAADLFATSPPPSLRVPPPGEGLGAGRDRLRDPEHRGQPRPRLLPGAYISALI